MTVEINLVELVVFAARVVHQHDISVGKVLADIFVEKRLGGVFLCLHGVALRVFARPGELRRRLAEVEGQHTIYRAKHLGLALLKVGSLGSLSSLLA